MNKKILITGSGGFLGRELSISLAEKGNFIFALDNNYRGNLKSIKKHKNIKNIKADVTNITQLRKHFLKYDVIYHLAAINGTENFYNHPDKVLEVGIIGTYNVIKLAKLFGVKKIVFASSSEVYNEPNLIPTPEEIDIKIPDIQNPRFSYSGSKIAGELMMINMLRFSKIDYLIFRPHNIIGPNMGFEHVIPQLTKKIFLNLNKKNKNVKIKVLGNGNETRSFMYINDFGAHVIYWRITW